MLRFDVENNRFNYRSAAVIIHGEHVLLHKLRSDDFWTLPGGRVEFFETSEDTIPREIKEELGVDSKVSRLLWHVENFFEYDGKKYHEVSNYFLAELVEEPDLHSLAQSEIDLSEIDFSGIEEDIDLVFRWVPLSRLSNYTVKPSFLVDGINNLPANLVYIKFDEL